MSHSCFPSAAIAAVNAGDMRVPGASAKRLLLGYQLSAGYESLRLISDRSDALSS